MLNSRKLGHAAAFTTIFIWGTTFTSSKILLSEFTPLELLLFRFIIGFLVLCIVCPRRLTLHDKKQEFIFALAGLCGVTIHYLTENIAVQYSQASTVGIIKSVSPLFVALLSSFVLKKSKLTASFFAGFMVVIAGIILVSTNGKAAFVLNPRGDFFALFSAFMWAVYSLIIQKIAGYGYSTALVTRRVFFYGLLFMLPMILPFGFQLGLERFARPELLFNLLFLGIGASALTFFSWNTAVRILGPVTTSMYIYVVPLITVAASFVILRESIGYQTVLGIALILLGLFVSERKTESKRRSIIKTKKIQTSETNL